jgi:carbon-monoxide dehydrogenase small subunit
MLACLMLAISCDGCQITTVEGIAQPDGKLHPLQESFLNHGAIQCGFCTPGMVVIGKALLDENPKPSEKEVREYIRGNLCRCTGYTQIVKAILDCATSHKDAKRKAQSA